MPRVGCACLDLLDSPGLPRVLVTLAAVMRLLLPGFLGGAVVVLHFVGRFQGFVAGRGLGGGMWRLSRGTSATNYVGVGVLR